jgi:hypothetical protein
MGLRDAVIKRTYLFPDRVSMEYLRGLNRRKLRPGEKSLPYAGYFYRELANIPIEDLERVNSDPERHDRATPIQDRAALAETGYLEMETGYAVMPDGSGVAATLVKMPGVTPEMLDWWFNWHCLEDLRYAIWCPVAHYAVRAKDPARHLDDSGIPPASRIHGSVHYVTERIHTRFPQRIRIEFLSPEEFGIPEPGGDESRLARAICANVYLAGLGLPIAAFLHAVRVTGDGVEYRSRYWSGYLVRDGRPVRVKLPPVVDVMELVRGICIHSLMEYHNLASFLPDIYREYGGKVEATLRK